MRNCKGFTLVELVVVIAVLAILAGISIPRIANTIGMAHGSKIIADMHSCESAVNIYYSRNGFFPDNTEALVGSHLAVWPKPSHGKAIINKNDGSELELTINASSYVYVKPTVTELSEKVGCVKLGGKTIQDLLTASEIILTLN